MQAGEDWGGGLGGVADVFAEADFLPSGEEGKKRQGVSSRRSEHQENRADKNGVSVLPDNEAIPSGGEDDRVDQ